MFRLERHSIKGATYDESEVEKQELIVAITTVQLILLNHFLDISVNT